MGSFASYLRTHRRKSGLSQQEMAELLGFKSSQVISRYERLSHVPSLRSALACQVLFDVEPLALFPGLFAEVEQLTIMRIRALSDGFLEGQVDEMIRRRQVILAEAIRRSEMRQT